MVLLALALRPEASPAAQAGSTWADPAREAACRLWGRVTTVNGENREGFLRWDRNATHWTDLLNGSRTLPPERVALVAGVRDADAPPRRRVLEVRGYRVSWDEPDPALSVRTSAAVRFGHLASLQVFRETSALLTLTDGHVEEWAPENSDLGSGMRGLVITGGGERARVSWEELDRVDFATAPPGAVPGDGRLHGTVEDRWGRRYTGWVAWDRDEALKADTLQGRAGGREYALPFAGIAGLEAAAGGTRVLLADGGTLILNGTNDVAEGNRGVQVVDPALGTVTVPWGLFRRVRFHPPAGPVRCGRPPPGEARSSPAADEGGAGPAAGLPGTVRTRDGRVLRGAIIWDGDEAAPWEQLDGEDRGVGFQVEMGRVATVRRRSFREAEVTLRDGRTLVLAGSNDVSEANRGILIRTGAGPVPREAGATAGPGGESGEWVLVNWNELEEVRFDGQM